MKVLPGHQWVARVGVIVVVAASADLSVVACSSLTPTTPSDTGGQSTFWGGGDHATAVRTNDGWMVTVVASGGTHQVTWSGMADGKPMLAFQTPGGSFYGPIAMDGVPDSADGANLAAYYLTLEAIAASAPIPLDFTKNSAQCQNTAGCDSLHSQDCTAQGGCCDAHDACINANCVGQGDSCNIFSMFAESGSAACAQCHKTVMKCFGVNVDGGASTPGPSLCCITPPYSPGDQNACGEAQQCMNNGTVVVDPRECAAAGITPPAYQTDGGATCLHAYLICASTADCCVGNCNPNVCVCNSIGMPCRSSADCCNSNWGAGEALSLTCRHDICVDL